LLTAPSEEYVSYSKDSQRSILQQTLLSLNSTLFPIDFAVVILFGVFMLSTLPWILSVRKWFKGPIPNISADEMAKAGGHVLGGIHSEPPVDKFKTKRLINRWTQNFHES